MAVAAIVVPAAVTLVPKAFPSTPAAPQMSAHVQSFKIDQPISAGYVADIWAGSTNTAMPAGAYRNPPLPAALSKAIGPVGPKVVSDIVNGKFLGVEVDAVARLHGYAGTTIYMVGSVRRLGTAAEDLGPFMAAILKPRSQDASLPASVWMPVPPSINHQWRFVRISFYDGDGNQLGSQDLPKRFRVIAQCTAQAPCGG